MYSKDKNNHPIQSHIYLDYYNIYIHIHNHCFVFLTIVIYVNFQISQQYHISYLNTKYSTFLKKNIFLPTGFEPVTIRWLNKNVLQSNALPTELRQVCIYSKLLFQKKWKISERFLLFFYLFVFFTWKKIMKNKYIVRIMTN